LFVKTWEIDKLVEHKAEIKFFSKIKYKHLTCTECSSSFTLSQNNPLCKVLEQVGNVTAA